MDRTAQIRSSVVATACHLAGLQMEALLLARALVAAAEEVVAAVDVLAVVPVMIVVPFAVHDRYPFCSLPTLSGQAVYLPVPVAQLPVQLFRHGMSEKLSDGALANNEIQATITYSGNVHQALWVFA